MNKKASSILLMVFEVLIAVSVIIVGINVAIEQGQSEKVRKIFIADDLALMINTVVGVPGDVVVGYPEDVEKYQFLLTGQSITVLVQGDGPEGHVTKNFQLPEGYTAEIDPDAQEAKNLCIEKKNYKVLLRKC